MNIFSMLILHSLILERIHLNSFSNDMAELPGTIKPSGLVLFPHTLQILFSHFNTFSPTALLLLVY